MQIMQLLYFEGFIFGEPCFYSFLDRENKVVHVFCKGFSSLVQLIILIGE